MFDDFLNRNKLYEIYCSENICFGEIEAQNYYFIQRSEVILSAVFPSIYSLFSTHRKPRPPLPGTCSISFERRIDRICRAKEEFLFRDVVYSVVSAFLKVTSNRCFGNDDISLRRFLIAIRIVYVLQTIQAPLGRSIGITITWNIRAFLAIGRKGRKAR